MSPATSGHSAVGDTVGFEVGGMVDEAVGELEHTPTLGLT